MGLGTKASGSLLTSDLVTKHTRSPALNHLKVFYFFVFLLFSFRITFFSFSFSFASHSHPERHYRVSFPFGLVPFLFPKGTTLTSSLCLFYIPCVFFYIPLSKKTQPSVSFCTLSSCALLLMFLTLFLLSPFHY